MDNFCVRKTRQGSLKVCRPDGSFFYAPSSMEPEIYVAINTGSEEDWAVLTQKASEKMAFVKAVELLGRRDHTGKELGRKLTERDFSPQAIEFALNLCREKGYLDDRRAVVAWLTSRSTAGKYSRLQILAKLQEKGIPRDQASVLVDEYFPVDDEMAAILKYLRVRKNIDKEKATAGLLRKGFSSRMIKSAFLLLESENNES